MQNCNDKIIEVTFIPHWGSATPYQNLLAESLEPLGIFITKPESSSGSIQRQLKDAFWKIMFGRQKTDILHLHWLPPFQQKPIRLFKLILYVLKLLILHIIGVRIVWTAHNMRPHESVSLRGDRLIAKMTAKIADAIIVHNEQARAKICSSFNLKKHNNIFVIPHGNYIGHYENNIDRASARLQLGIDDSKFIFLFLGRVRPYKGVLQLIDAYKTFRKYVPDSVLIIAGRPLDENFSNRIKEQISADCALQYRDDFVPDSQIQIYMNASDVTVFPYTEILTTGAVIMAMSFACACVAPNFGFTKDVLDDNGAFLYDPDEKDGLLNALKTAFARRENIASMGQYNFRKVSPWNWDYIAARTAEVYSHCLPGFPSKT
jgi:glycosyltransferase involved in cell wall biosynthesis